MAEQRALRDRLMLALDVEDLARAQALAMSLKEYFGVVKVGLELFCASGPAAVQTFVDQGFGVFADLKLHDIPTTVGRAAASIARFAPSYVSVHLAGGAAMLEAFAEGLGTGGGSRPPMGLGITVLTSDLDAPASLLSERAALAEQVGIGGVVCAGPDLKIVGHAAPSVVRVVPGTRPAGAAADDQARVITPAQAFADGADLLVIGRAVTKAADPVAAARELYASLSA